MDIGSVSNRGMIGSVGGPAGGAGVAGPPRAGNQGADVSQGASGDNHDAVQVSAEASEHDGPSAGGVGDLLRGLDNHIHDSPHASERLELSGRQQQSTGFGDAHDLLRGLNSDIHDRRPAPERGAFGQQQPPRGKD